MTVENNVQDKATELLLNMVDVTIKTMNDVVEFSKEQIPEVIQQLLVWNMVINLISFCLGVALLGAGIFIVYKALTGYVKAEAGTPSFWLDRAFAGTKFPSTGMSLATIFSFGMIIFGLVMTKESMDWLKIWIAPKVWLIEYAAEIIKR